MPHNGSAISSPQDTLPPGMSTSAVFLTCGPAISPDIRNAISLPASADGPLPCDSPAGPTLDLFGQEVAPASPSPQPERARRPMTNATCGLRGYLSSPSAALQSSLESRLKRQLAGAGSTLFSLIWRQKATPAGRPYYQLAASGRPTSDSGLGSWPTATANENIGDLDKKAERRAAMKEKWKGVSGNGFGHSMSEIAQRAACPTPMAGTPAQKGYNEAGNTDNGRKTVVLASWATPRSTEAGHSSGNPDRAHDGKSRLEDQVFLATWPTPRAEDSESSGMRHSRGVADTMTAVASLASWATPTSRDWKDGGSSLENVPVNALFGRQVLLASGPTPNGSPAPTESPGQLDPDHSRWVMGYETEHLNCAPTETPSSLRRQRSSSAPPRPDA